MKNFRDELNVLVTKLETRIVERQNEYDDYLSEASLTPNVHTIGELQHVKMKIDNFKRQIAIAEYHTSTVLNFTISYNSILNELNGIIFKSLKLKI